MSNGLRWTKEQYEDYLRGRAAGILDEVKGSRELSPQTAFHMARKKEKSLEDRHNRIAWKKRKQELLDEGFDAEEAFCVSFFRRKQNRKV